MEMLHLSLGGLLLRMTEQCDYLARQNQLRFQLLLCVSQFEGLDGSAGTKRDAARRQDSVCFKAKRRLKFQRRLLV